MTKVKWKDGGKWSEIDQTWGDYQLVEEIVDEIGLDHDGGIPPDGGTSGWSKKRKEKLDQFLDKDEEKKKKLIRLICRIKGEKVYDEEKEVGKVDIKIEDVDMIIKEVLGKIKVETKDVL